MDRQHKRQYKIIAAVMAAFVLLAIILLFSNGERLRAGKAAQQEKTLTFTCEGQTLATLTADEIETMPAETFDAVIRSSGAKPQQVTYTGVPLAELFTGAGIDLSGKKQLTFLGADAYVSVVKVEELKEKQGFYVAYAINGEPMKTKAEGGFGPYQLVIRDDPFSQRWCKYLAEVQIE